MPPRLVSHRLSLSAWALVLLMFRVSARPCRSSLGPVFSIMTG